MKLLANIYVLKVFVECRQLTRIAFGVDIIRVTDLSLQMIDQVRNEIYGNITILEAPPGVFFKSFFFKLVSRLPITFTALGAPVPTARIFKRFRI